MPITHDAYQKYLKPDSMVTIYMKGTVRETKKSYAKIDTISMRKPALEIHVSITSFIKNVSDMPEIDLGILKYLSNVPKNLCETSSKYAMNYAVPHVHTQQIT